MASVTGGDFFDDCAALVSQGAEKLANAIGFGTSGPSVSGQGIQALGEIFLGTILYVTGTVVEASEGVGDISNGPS